MSETSGSLIHVLEHRISADFCDTTPNYYLRESGSGTQTQKKLRADLDRFKSRGLGTYYYIVWDLYDLL